VEELALISMEWYVRFVRATSPAARSPARTEGYTHALTSKVPRNLEVRLRLSRMRWATAVAKLPT